MWGASQTPPAYQDLSKLPKFLKVAKKVQLHGLTDPE